MALTKGALTELFNNYNNVNMDTVQEFMDFLFGPGGPGTTGNLVPYDGADKDFDLGANKFFVGSGSQNTGADVEVRKLTNNSILSITTDDSTKIAQLFVRADGTTDYISVYQIGSTKPNSGLYLSGSSVVESNTARLLFINYDAAGTLVFGQGSTGTAGEAMRVADNRNVSISGAAAAKISTPQALLHMGAGNANFAQLLLPVSVAPSVPIDGQIWREDNTNTGLKIRVNGVTKTVTLA